MRVSIYGESIERARESLLEALTFADEACRREGPREAAVPES